MNKMDEEKWHLGNFFKLNALRRKELSKRMVAVAMFL